MARDQGRQGEDTGVEYVYPAAGYSVDTRNTIGRLYAAWSKDGKKPRYFEDLLKKAGYRVNRPSLNNWRSAVVKGGDPVGRYKNCGRKSLLSTELHRVVVGSVLAENARGEVVSARSVAQLADDKVGVKMSEESARLLIRRSGFSSRLARRSTSGMETDIGKLGEMYSKWLREAHASGFLQLHPSKIGSIDFTFTRQTTTRWKTYAPRGRYAIP